MEGLGFAGRVEGGGGVGAVDLEFVEGQVGCEGWGQEGRGRDEAGEVQVAEVREALEPGD